MPIGSIEASRSSEELRADLVTHLVAQRWIRTQGVEAAFRAVPRHVFMPDGVTPTEAYADTTVTTKRGPDGTTTSSVSAPWLQAYMLEQARLRPGDRVLEIGSSGVNAALLAELVGPDGIVATVDIDSDVVSLAQAGLDRAGYAQVEVVCGDGEYGHQPAAPYDAIVVTVETADIPPAWLDQLAPDGVLVLPLRIRGLTRCLTLQRRDGHLAASATLQCGFVPLCRLRHNATYADPTVMPTGFCGGYVHSGSGGQPGLCDAEPRQPTHVFMLRRIVRRGMARVGVLKCAT